MEVKGWQQHTLQVMDEPTGVALQVEVKGWKQHTLQVMDEPTGVAHATPGE